MDTLEVITLANTTVDEEFSFLEFACRNRKVRLIKHQATLDGPEFISLSDFRKIKAIGSSSDGSLFLWNMGLPNRLSWSPYLHRYDETWTPINPDYGTHIRIPRSRNEFLQLFASFRKQPATERLFRFGHFHQYLSPIVELNISTEKTKQKSNDYFSVTANFCNWVNQEVWLVWNAYEQKWEHETSDISQWAETLHEQPTEFLSWQEQIFAWVKSNLGSKLVPASTYRYGSDDEE